MKIAFKFIIGFIIVSILAAIAAFFGINAINSINNANQDIIQQTLPVINALEELKFSGIRIVTSTHELISAYSENQTGDPEIDVEYERIESAKEQYNISLERYEEFIIKFFPDEKKFVESIRASGMELQKASLDIITMKERKISGDKIEAKLKEFEGIEQNFLRSVDTALANEDDEISKRQEIVGYTIAEAKKIIIISSMFIFIIAIIIGVYITRNFVRPIIKFRDASIQIGRGNLDTRIDIHSKDEMEDMANSFNKMASDLKRSSAAIIGSRKFVDNIITSMADMLIVLDMDMKIKKVNYAVRDNLGYTEEELIGKPIGLITGDDELFKSTGIEEFIRKGIIRNIDKTYMAKDGRKISVSFSGSVMYDENGKIQGIVCAAHDITQRKMIMEQLRQKNDLVNATLESLPYPFYVIDAKDHTIVLANSALNTWHSSGRSSEHPLEYLSGHPLEHLSEKPTCYGLIHRSEKPCNGSGSICPLEEVKRTKKPVIIEHIHYDRAGNPGTVEVHCYPIMDNNGNVVRAIEYYLDITERKQVENAILESEVRNRAILDAIPDMIFRLSEDGIIVGFKPSKDIKMQTAPEELLGINIISIYPAELEKQILQKIDIAIQTGATQVFEFVFPIKNAFYEYEARLIPIEHRELFFMVRDTTDLKRAEELRIENEKLLRSSIAKSQFLATMSHELRTPLNSIIGFSTLIEQSGKLDNKYNHFIENVIVSGKHLLGLIDDILDLSKVEAGKMEITPEKISVPAIIEESIQTIKERANKQNVELKITLDPQLDVIETDGIRFRQILLNLLTNAVKFSKPEGGTVTLISEKEGAMARFSISDKGIGIKDEDKGRLFMTFEQMETGITRKYGGTGLGLAITKKLLEMQGGRITVESEYGVGSTFTFYLPISRKE